MNCVICNVYNKVFVTCGSNKFCYSCFNKLTKCEKCKAVTFYGSLCYDCGFDKGIVTMTKQEHDMLNFRIDDLKKINERLMNQLIPEKQNNSEIKKLITVQFGGKSIDSELYSIKNGVINIECPTEHIDSMLELLETPSGKPISLYHNQIYGEFKVVGEAAKIVELKRTVEKVGDYDLEYFVLGIKTYQGKQKFYEFFKDRISSIDKYIVDVSDAQLNQYVNCRFEIGEKCKRFDETKINILHTVLSYYYGLVPKNNEYQYITDRKYFYVYEKCDGHYMVLGKSNKRSVFDSNDLIIKNMNGNNVNFSVWKRIKLNK